MTGFVYVAIVAWGVTFLGMGRTLLCGTRTVDGLGEGSPPGASTPDETG